MASIAEAMADLKRAEVIQTVEHRLASGEDPVHILNDCRDGMLLIGKRYSEGDYFLAELMLAGEVFSDALQAIAPHLRDHRKEGAHRSIVLLATPKGDIHDLGKNIVSMMLDAYGFEILDLGVDVTPERIVEAATEVKPQFIGLSALLTTALVSCQMVAAELAAAGLRDTCKLMIGGGVTTPLAKARVGADFQTTDVMEGLEYCLRIDAELDDEVKSGSRNGLRVSDRGGCNAE